MKQTSESSPLLPEAKSKAATNGVSPLAISKKPEVIFSSFSFSCSLYSPRRNQTLWSWESKSLGLVELLARVEASLVDLVEANLVDLVEANLGTAPGSRRPWVTPPGMFFSLCLYLLICPPTGRSRLTRSSTAGWKRSSPIQVQVHGNMVTVRTWVVVPTAKKQYKRTPAQLCAYQACPQATSPQGTARGPTARTPPTTKPPLWPSPPPLLPAKNNHQNAKEEDQRRQKQYQVTGWRAKAKGGGPRGATIITTIITTTTSMQGGWWLTWTTRTNSQKKWPFSYEVVVSQWS